MATVSDTMNHKKRAADDASAESVESSKKAKRESSIISSESQADTSSIVATQGNSAHHNFAIYALRHLLHDSSEHPMYATHFNLAIAHFSPTHGDNELAVLLKALDDENEAQGWDTEKAKAAKDRFRSYYFTNRTKSFAGLIESKEELIAVLGALTNSVADKPAGSSEDNADFQDIVKSLHNCINAPKGKTESNVSVINNEPPATEKKDHPTLAKWHDNPAQIAKKVKLAVECLEVYLKQVGLTNSPEHERKAKLKSLFQAPIHLYNAYRMGEIGAEVAEKKQQFDPAKAYITARTMYHQLPEADQQEWAKRLTKLLEGDLTMLSKFRCEMQPKKDDETAHESHNSVRGNESASKKSMKKSTKKSGDGEKGDADSNCIADDGTVIKEEDGNDAVGRLTTNMRRSLSVQPTSRPEASVLNPPSAPHSFGAPAGEDAFASQRNFISIGNFGTPGPFSQYAAGDSPFHATFSGANRNRLPPPLTYPLPPKPIFTALPSIEEGR